MKATTILISCAFLGSIATVQADGKGFGDGTLPEFLANYDLDGNGMLDEEEVQAMKQLRKEAREQNRNEFDADGDGHVSIQERDQVRQQLQTEIETTRAEKFAGIAGDDGVLTFDEFAAIPALADVDPDVVAAMFARLDADGDGVVTLEEFMARLRHHEGPQESGSGDGGEGPSHGDGPGDGGPGDGGPGDGGPGGGGPGDGTCDPPADGTGTGGK